MDERRSPTLTVGDLMVDHAVNPLGIGNTSPQFYWTLSDPTVRGQKQTAYRIGVASSAQKLAADDYDLWDSGKVESDETVGIRYAGRPLAASTPCFWQVTVWDKDKMTAVSEPAFFETGLTDGFGKAIFITRDQSAGGIVDADFFGANWIWLLDGDRFDEAKEGKESFYKRVTLSDGIVSAVLLYTADDYGTVYLNGQKVHEAQNVPNRWRTGNAVDVTDRLVCGENEISADIVNTSTGFGGFLCKLQVTYRDGSRDEFVTDGSWLCRRDGDWAAPDQAVAYGGFPWENGVTVPPFVAGANFGAPIVKKEFTLENKEVAYARAYATAAGLYVLQLNGRKVGDDFLTPGFTEYGKHLMAQTFDITDLLQKKNTVCFTLGNGWYIGAVGAAFGGRFPALLAKLVITYKDSTRQVIDTDESWLCTLDGPVVENDLFNGESYDATRTEFSYAPVTAVNAEDLKIGDVIAQTPGTNIRCMDAREPVAVTEPQEGKFVYDFGQNLAGVVEITVKAPAGTLVTIRHAEMLNDGSRGSDGAPGTLYTTNLRTAKATDTYRCGGKTETYAPSFTYHGFRYAELSGIRKEDIVSVRALVLYSALNDTSTFSCSDERIDRLALNAYWGQRSNFLSVPTDCPQRDERMGWSGDAQIFVGTAAYQMDVKGFYTQYLMDLNDCQRDNGAYPDCAPASDRPSYNGSGHGGWADAGIIIPYTIALRYGDRSLVAAHYDNMARYIDYLVKDAGDYIRNTQFAYGDWLSFDSSTPVELCDTAYCAYVTHLMSVMAGWLGKDADAAVFEEHSRKFKAAWNKKYLASDGRTHCDSQTSYVLGLHFEIIPEDLRERAAARLDERIRENQNKLTTGFMGVSYLLPVLCKYGYVDTAFALLMQTECPSWLYPVTQGATTVWERWDSYSEKGFGDAGMNSYNHYSYGSVMEWVYSSLLGITCEDGWKHFLLKPLWGGGLTHAKGSYRSVNGTVESGWVKEGGTVTYRCVVPANTTATLILPNETHELASGTYTFRV